MPDRDPYEFSALAPDSGEHEDAAPGRPRGRFSRPGDPGPLDDLDDDDFEAELERLASEEQGLSLDDSQIDANLRALQRALVDLGEGISDPDLDAEEAWLEALLLEDGTGTEE